MKQKILFSIILLLVFSYGMLAGSYKIFPYEYLDKLKHNIFLQTANSTLESSLIFETDTQSLIHINDKNDVLEKRIQLRNFIWKQNFPHSLIPTVTNDIHDSNFDGFSNLARIDLYVVNMEYGVDSKAYLFTPTNPNDSLIIYHHGHSNGFHDARNVQTFFLNKGYSVLAFSMPLKGINNQPIVDHPDFGKIKLTSHDMFVFLESDQFSPIKYFVEPIFISLNYVDTNYNFDSYHMLGISGGGWTTTLYSALDDRISASYSIAGSVPIYLRSIPENLGDYEQITPDLYRIAEYLDLYVMAAYGDHRKHMQIFNKYDPCCFGGLVSKTYENEVKSKISSLNEGNFEIFIDESHREHKISDISLNYIYNDLQK